MRFIRTALVALLATASVVPVHARPEYCEVLGQQAVLSDAEVLHAFAGEDDKSHFDRPLHRARAADRLLFVYVTCPDQFYEAASLSDGSFLGAWGQQVERETALRRDEQQDLIAASVAQAQIPAASQKDERARESVASVFKNLAVPPKQRDAREMCGARYRHLLIGLVDDWISRDGDLWFDYSDSLLFMMAACPDDFYYIMGQRREVLRSWLRDLPHASFWDASGGDQRKRLEHVRTSLVNLVASQPVPDFLKATHDEILGRLKQICVTVVDEPEPPCAIEQDKYR